MKIFKKLTAMLLALCFVLYAVGCEEDYAPYDNFKPAGVLIIDCINGNEYETNIKNADFVVTDTFHGTIFSTIMRKQFVSIVRDSNREKLSFLLEKLELSDRQLKNPDDMESLLTTKIDYTKTAAVIEKERQHTMEYLKNNL